MAELDEALSRFFSQHQPMAMLEGLEGMEGFFEKLVDPWEMFFGERATEKKDDAVGDREGWVAKLTKETFYDFMDLAEIPRENKDAMWERFRTTTGEGLIGLIFAMATHVYLRVTGMKSMLGGLGTLMEQVTNRLQRPHIPDINALIQESWKRLNRADLELYGPKHGFTLKEIKTLETAARPSFGLTDISALRAMLEMKTSDAYKELARAGWPSIDEKDEYTKITGRAFALLTPQIAIGDILEAERRGLLEKIPITSLLMRHGLTKQQRAIYKELVKRLPNLSELQEMRRRGLITDDLYNADIVKLGYSEEHRTKVAELFETLPDYYLARTLWWRDVIDDDTYKRALSDLGYTTDIVDGIVKVSNIVPNPTDLVLMGVREVFTPHIRRRFRQDEDFPKDILPWARKIGISEEVMRMHWAKHWDLPGIQHGFNMFHRGILKPADLRMLLRAKDVMPFWRDRLIGLSYRLIPRRTLPRMVKFGVIDRADLVERFLKLGFNPKDAGLMSDTAVLRAKEEERQLTKGDIVAGFVYDEISAPGAEQLLRDLGYGDDTVKYLMLRAVYKQQTRVATDLKKLEPEEAKKAREASRGEIVKGYREGAIKGDAAAQYLKQIGYSDNAVGYMLALQDFVRTREIREHRAKEIRKLFDARLLTDTLTVVKLSAAGYTNLAATSLTDAWAIERDTAEQLDAAKIRQPSRTDLADWLKKNIISETMWWERMQGLKYAENDIIAFYLEIVHDVRET